MRLKDFFLGEAETTFKNPGKVGSGKQMDPYAAPVPPQIEEPEPPTKLDTLPPEIAELVQQIEADCSELVQSQGGDPELKEVVHAFLLKLSKWQASEE